jgi:stress-induced-phosphoprotein 1
MSSFERAAAFKAEGNTFFKAKDYESAIDKYTQAIALNDRDVTYFSNRSACYHALGKWAEAADDGRSCIMVDKNFVKGYFRQATALKSAGDISGASEACKRGLGIDSSNKDLKAMSKELDEMSRQKRVTDAISKGQEELSSNDIAAAYKTIDGALRLDPSNSQLKKLMDKIKPKYEKMEKDRKSALSGPERIKEQGDSLFKNANFEGAIEQYTKAIDSIKDKGSDIALKCYGNRAACWKQLSNFDETIGDCSHVLEYRENDVKALIRRAQAFEACERYKFALQDARQVISLGMETTGKATFDLANGMQHRLNKVIQQLKQG